MNVGVDELSFGQTADMSYLIDPHSLIPEVRQVRAISTNEEGTQPVSEQIHRNISRPNLIGKNREKSRCI